MVYGNQVVYPMEPAFSLQTFPDFIHCYIFLCKVADYIAEQVNNLIRIGLPPICV